MPRLSVVHFCVKCNWFANLNRWDVHLPLCRWPLRHVGDVAEISLISKWIHSFPFGYRFMANDWTFFWSKNYQCLGSIQSVTKQNKKKLLLSFFFFWSFRFEKVSVPWKKRKKKNEGRRPRFCFCSILIQQNRSEVEGKLERGFERQQIDSSVIEIESTCNW